ncbi:uncharacterized protein PFL1_02204 [Pseudozyma flocculosa PF-1]|uniref:Uncharacterized protein n=1 Tax=Pseudozyma flocculosa TaxID=84751 RepID=A0A5C3FAF2_9BASI|nr:uncharacterized protein PFL1_02204 [Pseudozyma flocculosa PF-1]EPQ30087.1 hypothetical protein PFL1_02204 [Pseudozyma flocculosa PF-1]SPO41433.1 uncharacterized protein PSFLO_06915 [Pseudozyma flocculosa]
MSSLPAVGGARPAGSASPVNVAQDQATRGRQHRGATSTPTPRGGRFGRSRSPLAGHRDYADTPTSSTGRSSIRDYAADATTSRNNPHERSHDVDGNSNAAQGADMEPLTRHTDDAQMMAAQLTQALLQLANNATTAQPAAAASPTKSFDTRLDEACSAHHWVSRALAFSLSLRNSPHTSTISTIFSSSRTTSPTPQ